MCLTPSGQKKGQAPFAGANGASPCRSRRRHARLGEQRVFRRCERPDHTHRPRRAQLFSESRRANGVVELTPFEFLNRLADLVPPPQKQRPRYHGVFALNHKLRRAVTALAIGNIGKRCDAATSGQPTEGCCDTQILYPFLLRVSLSTPKPYDLGLALFAMAYGVIVLAVFACFSSIARRA
jgi:hypothetical protein